MQTRGIIGRTIVSIDHERMHSTGSSNTPHVVRITLDNGVVLTPFTIEHNEGAFYGTDFHVHKPRKAVDVQRQGSQ